MRKGKCRPIPDWCGSLRTRLLSWRSHSILPWSRTKEACARPRAISGLGMEIWLGSSVVASLGKLDGVLKTGVCGRTWAGRGGGGGRDPASSMSSKDGGTGLSSDIHATGKLAVLRMRNRQAYAFRMHSALECLATPLAEVSQAPSTENSSTHPPPRSPWPSALIYDSISLPALRPCFEQPRCLEDRRS